MIAGISACVSTASLIGRVDGVFGAIVCHVVFVSTRRRFWRFLYLPRFVLSRYTLFYLMHYCTYLFVRGIYYVPTNVYLNRQLLHKMVDHIHNQMLDGFTFYSVVPLFFSGFMLIHMIALQSILTLIGYLLPNRFSSTLAGIVILFMLNLTSGLPLHLRDLTPWFKEWLGIISPTRWILPMLLKREFSEYTLAGHSTQIVCRNRQV